MTRMPQWLLALAPVGCLALTGASAAVAQRAASDFYYDGASRVPVSLALDSLAVQLRGGVRTADVAALVAPDFRPVRETAGGILVFASPTPWPRARLFARARALAQAHGNVLSAAGLIAHAPGGDRPPLLVTDDVIVRFKRGVARTTVDSVALALGLAIVGAPDLDARRYVLAVTAQSPGDALAVARRLHESVLTDLALPDFIGGVVPALQPNDPLLSRQWHLDNNGLYGGTAGADIGAFDAWDVTMGSTAITIAIVELDGFDAKHPDLCDPNGSGACSNLWTGIGAGGLTIHGWNFDARYPVGPDVAVGMLYHGTAVAGLAGAAGGNGVGVTGVCPRCRLMLLRTGERWSDIAAAFKFARDSSAAVINASWDLWWPNGDAYLEIEAAANDGREGRGAVVVFALPNVDNRVAAWRKDWCVGSPVSTAALPFVIAVAAATNEDKRAYISAEGDCLDLLAPGATSGSRWGIATTDPQGATDDGHLNPTHTWSFTAEKCPALLAGGDVADPDYTACFGGNSAAAPIVAGVAGLVLSVAPSLTSKEVADVLYRTADKIEYDVTDASDPNLPGYAPVPPDPSAWSKTHGYGRVNAARAVEEAKTLAGPAASVPGSVVVVLLVIVLIVLVILCWWRHRFAWAWGWRSPGPPPPA